MCRITWLYTFLELVIVHKYFTNFIITVAVHKNVDWNSRHFAFRGRPPSLLDTACLRGLACLASPAGVYVPSVPINIVTISFWTVSQLIRINHGIHWVVLCYLVLLSAFLCFLLLLGLMVRSRRSFRSAGLFLFLVWFLVKMAQILYSNPQMV